MERQTVQQTVTIRASEREYRFGGCVMLIEVLTQNNTHTHHAIKHLLSKNGLLFTLDYYSYCRGTVLLSGLDDCRLLQSVELRSLEMCRQLRHCA